MIGKPTLRFWLVTAASAIGIAATVALGAWQLGRAHDKLALQADIEQRHALPELDAKALLGADASQYLHRTVVLTGRWDTRHTVFLDNRQMQGKPGFYVVTPLLLEGTRHAVLVERGWVQRNFVNREVLPPIETPQGPVELHGRIAPPPARLYDFAGAAPGPIRQNLDLAAFRAETGLALADLAVVQTGPPTGGLLRDWPLPATGVEKHYGYVFQWWAIAAVIAFLYAWFQFIAPRRKPKNAG